MEKILLEYLFYYRGSVRRNVDMRGDTEIGLPLVSFGIMKLLNISHLLCLSHS